MKTALQMAPVVGAVAVCAALGVSRATYYRHKRVASVSASASVEQGGLRPVAAAGGEGKQGATAPPSGLEHATPSEAARNGQQPAPLADAAAVPSESRRSRVGTSPAHVGASTSDEQGGLRPVAAAGGEGKQGATAPPSAPESAPAVEAARNGQEPAPLAADAVAPVPSELRRSSPRALSADERALVLATLNEDRFCNLAPAEVYATLLDEGRYLCSERTMYRILDEHSQVRERRNQLRHPSYVTPELMATKPNQLWSWDITKLKTFVKSQYLHLYVILDVYSRYVVGWMVAEYEAGELAKALIDETCERQRITPGELTFHADNGAAMVSQPVAFLLASLGITKSHSRPHVSDDNPFSEAQFKTLKYRPGFPERFASLDHARKFLREFFAWYNTQHHHDALALLTPHDVHHGLVSERLAQRARVLDAAYAAHPERFVHRPPTPAGPPPVVWINPPKSPSPPPQTPSESAGA